MTNTSGTGGPAVCDIIVRNGAVLTLDAERTVYASGAVAIEGNTIVAVGPERDILAAYRSPRTLDAGGAPVHPGFIDAHIHIGHHTCRGVFADTMASSKQPVSFADWKADVRAEDDFAAASLGCVELLRNGFTTFMEPGTSFHQDAVAEAVEAVGLRAALAEPYLWDRPDILELAGGLRSDSLLARATPTLDRALDTLGSQLYRNKDPNALVRGYICLYGEGTASDELERAAKAIARENGVNFQQHDGYLPTIAAVEKERLGHSRTTHLAELGVLDEDSALVHMSAIFDEDEDVLLKTGASVVWCPVAYFTLGISPDAPTRMAGMHRRGINVALGLDGALDCAIGDAARTAHLVARNAQDFVPPSALLEMQTCRAAKATGYDDIAGSLEVGKRADIVIRSLEVAEMRPGYNPIHQLALTSRVGSVDTVLIDGRIVLRGGQVTNVDEGVVHAEALSSVQRRVERLGMGTISDWPVVE